MFRNQSEKKENILNTILNTLTSFDPVFLSDFPVESQMSRFDNKYIFPQTLVPRLLISAGKSYNVLEINKMRVLKYFTHYYDTKQFDMYHDHHNGKGERYKIRLREYIDTHEEFLEIKRKNNNGRMVKQRIPLPELTISTDEASELINKASPYNPNDLQLSLSTAFNRITLLNKNYDERVTLDICLEFQNREDKLPLPWLGIAEVKKPTGHSRVKFEEILKETGIPPVNFSKYCTGMAYLNKSIKTNNFKENMLTIKRFENEYYMHIK